MTQNSDSWSFKLCIIDVNRSGDWFQDMEIADSGSWENSVISGHQLSVGFAMVCFLGEMSDQQTAGNVAIHKLPKAVIHRGMMPEKLAKVFGRFGPLVA